MGEIIHLNKRNAFLKRKNHKTLTQKHPEEHVLCSPWTEFLQFKKSHPGNIILVKLGWDYGVFFEDALLVSKHLGLALRSTKLASQDREGEITMHSCDVPANELASCVSKLFRAGRRVIICSINIEKSSSTNKMVFEVERTIEQFN